jgi:hypothetical protein
MTVGTEAGRLALISGSMARTGGDQWAYSTPPCHPHSEAGWRSDAALELWIDVERDPVVIRLAGTLDAATGSNLVSVIQELIDGGSRRFELETSRLSVSGLAGRTLLEEVRRTVQSSGGELWLDASLVARISRACDDHGRPTPRSPGATMTQPAAAGR